MSESSKLFGLVSKFQWRHQISNQNEAKILLNLLKTQILQEYSYDGYRKITIPLQRLGKTADSAAAPKWPGEDAGERRLNMERNY